jgi:hypothetical protein
MRETFQESKTCSCIDPHRSIVLSGSNVTGSSDRDPFFCNIAALSCVVYYWAIPLPAAFSKLRFGLFRSGFALFRYVISRLQTKEGHKSSCSMKSLLIETLTTFVSTVFLCSFDFFPVHIPPAARVIQGDVWYSMTYYIIYMVLMILLDLFQMKEYFLYSISKFSGRTIDWSSRPSCRRTATSCISWSLSPLHADT